MSIRRATRLTKSRHETCGRQRRSWAQDLPAPELVQVFASVVPEIVVPYADAAAVMLANLDRGNAMSRHRVGLALPKGTHGRTPNP